MIAIGLALALTFPPGPAASPPGRRVIARTLVVVADDFVVDLYHDGMKVPDAKRTLVEEIHGATVERVDLEVREGDWVVFNVVNNRLRWGGALYFAVAGLEAGERGADSGFVSTNDLRWSCCDDPLMVPRFLADREYLSDRVVQVIENRWPLGDERMAGLVPGWGGQPIWGDSRNTWIKFRAGPID
jgi:hypothetical protein